MLLVVRGNKCVKWSYRSLSGFYSDDCCLRTDKTTLRTQYSGLPLRTFGNQEFDIVSALDNACKYAETITDPRKVRYCLEKAFYLARNGRPGPCWLDIPIDIQGANIDPEQQEGYLPEAIRVDAGTIIEKKIKIYWTS